MKKCLSVIAAIAAMLSATSSGAHGFGEVIVANICNHDDKARIAYAVMDKWWAGKKIGGWYRVEPNQCQDVWRHSSDQHEHHFIFAGKGEYLDVSWGRGHMGEAFCVDPDNGFEITETMFNAGRGTTCQGNEELRQGNVFTLGTTVTYLEISPWSE